MSTGSFHSSPFLCVVAALLIICKPVIGQTYDSRPIETFAGGAQASFLPGAIRPFT